MATGAIFRLIMSAPKGVKLASAYAFEMQAYDNLEVIPRYGDLITDIVVKTSGKMREHVTFCGEDGTSTTAMVRMVEPGWYWIHLSRRMRLNARCLKFEPLGFPAENRVFINWAFVDFKRTEGMDKKFHIPDGLVAPPLPPRVLPLAHSERMMTMPHVTHFSWGSVKHPIKLSAHGLTLFEIKDEDHRKAMEIINGGHSVYDTGSGFFPSRMGPNEVTLVAGQKKLVSAIPSRL